MAIDSSPYSPIHREVPEDKKGKLSRKGLKESSHLHKPHDIQPPIMQLFFFNDKEALKRGQADLEAVHRDLLCLLELSPTELQKGQG